MSTEMCDIIHAKLLMEVTNPFSRISSLLRHPSRQKDATLARKREVSRAKRAKYLERSKQVSRAKRAKYLERTKQSISSEPSKVSVQGPGKLMS